MDLKGKNALITGGAKRIGRAIALALAEKGANVAVHYHQSKREAEELVKLINEKNLKPIGVRGNIEKPKEIKGIVERASDSLGGLDILINNAAIFYPTPISEITEEDWDKFLDVNLKAQFYFSREFASVKRGGIAKIINMADSYGASPAAQFIPYGVSKAGVIALTKGLAKAYAPGILVNCICPAVILPREGPDKASEQKAITTTLLKRGGSVGDITKTVVFLAENDYITGEAIFVDGGRHV